MTNRQSPQNDLAVWWLQPAEIRQLVADGGETRDLWRCLGIPEYIGFELLHSFGRSGNGRLWPAKGITCDKIDWRDESTNAQYCREAVGIVFWRKDVYTLHWMPGVVTDCSLNTISTADALLTEFSGRYKVPSFERTRILRQLQDVLREKGLIDPESLTSTVSPEDLPRTDQVINRGYIPTFEDFRRSSR